VDARIGMPICYAMDAGSPTTNGGLRRLNAGESLIISCGRWIGTGGGG
jgi:hypothetical protein